MKTRKITAIFVLATLLSTGSVNVWGQTPPVNHDPIAFSQRAAQFSEKIRSAFEQISLMEDQLKAANEMADGLRKAYSVVDALFVGGGTLDELYYQTEGLLADAQYINDNISRMTADGTISMRDASTMIRSLEFTTKEALSMYNSVRKLIDDNKNGVNLDIRSRIDILNFILDNIKSKRSMMKDEFQAKVEEVQAATAAATLEQMLDASYSDVDVILPDGSTMYVPSAEEIYKRLAKKKTTGEPEGAQQQEGASTVSEMEKATSEAAKEAIETIKGSDNGGGALSPLGRFLMMAVGILALAFGLPTYLKVTSGERQSRNALWKWIVGTVTMVGLIFLFDMIF